jgi:hypothetical protein
VISLAIGSGESSHFGDLQTISINHSEENNVLIALKSNPETAPKYADELHKWYAQNKQQAIVSEIEAFLGE